MSMQWYYAKDGLQIGPVEEAELLAKLASGEVAPTDLVWHEGMSVWLPAASKPALFPIPPLPTTPPKIPPWPGGVEIPNYLWQAIVVTILCCWPFGIPAIIYAAKVDSLKNRGDIAGAKAASANAKTWCIVAACVNGGILLLGFLVKALFVIPFWLLNPHF